MSGLAAAGSADCDPNPERKNRMYAWVPLGWLLLAVTIVHHPALWIDHVLWDEVSFEKMSADGDMSGKISSLSDQGVGSAYPFYVLFSHSTEPTRTLRLFSFLSIWILAAVIYRVLRQRAGLTNAQAMGAALVMVTYPAFQMYANAGASIYVIHTAIFGLAAECYLSGCAGPESRRWWLVPAAALWTVSFTLQPLLVYFYAFFAAIALSRPVEEWRTLWQNDPLRASHVRIHAVLWSLPFLHYFLQKAMFPLHPYFASWYNRPTFDLTKNLHDGLAALNSSLIAPVRHIVAQGPHAWVLISVAGLLLICGVSIVMPREVAGTDTARPLAPARMILAGLVLLVGGLFPFVMTGKPPAPEGPETRFAILVAPSLAIIAAGCLARTAEIFSRGLRWGVGFLGCSLLAGFSLSHARVYIGWQAAAIKDHAIVMALRTMSPPPNINYFIITGPALEHGYTRRHYDWSYLLHLAWGGYDRTAEMLDRLGPTDHHYYTPIGLSREKMANFRQWMGYGHPGPPDGWCRVEFHPAANFDFGLNPWRTVATDLGYRLRGKAKERAAWLGHFIPNVTLSPPIPYRFGAEALLQQNFQWEASSGWRELSPRTLISIAPAKLELHVHESLKGRFSIMPLGSHGFALRCDALPEGEEPAVVNIELRTILVPERDNRIFGLACEVHAFQEAALPRLFLITPGKEIEAVRPRPDLDILEAWATEPPLRSWIVWTTSRQGDVAQVKNLRFGFTQATPAPSY